MNDIEIARKYTNKAHNASQKGHEFDLTFAQFKRVINAKRCYYTGVELTSGAAIKENIPTNITIDRVDNSKGYIPGNVVACCFAYNQFKSVLENPSNPLDAKNVMRGLKREQELLKKQGKK